MKINVVLAADSLNFFDGMELLHFDMMLKYIEKYDFDSAEWKIIFKEMEQIVANR